MIILEKKIKNLKKKFKEFLKCKNKHTLIRKFNTTSNEKKNYGHPTFKQYKKKSHQFISSLLYGKKLHERKEKKIKALGLTRGRTHR
jgi:hypothetical protein